MRVRSAFLVSYGGIGPSTASLANQAPVYCGCPAGTHGCDLVSRARLHRGDVELSYISVCIPTIVEQDFLQKLLKKQKIENDSVKFPKERLRSRVFYIIEAGVCVARFRIRSWHLAFRIWPPVGDCVDEIRICLCLLASLPRPKVLPLPLPRSCAAPAFWNQSTCSGTKCTCMPGGSATLKIIMGMLKMALQIPRLNGRASVGDM